MHSEIGLLNNLSIMAKNLKLLLKGRPHRFSYDAGKDLFVVKEGQRRHYFSHLRRGFGLYNRGLTKRGDVLWRSYLLHMLEFAPDDIVVDCGANYADLWLVLEQKINPQNYITFEPGSEEFRTVCANAPLSNNANLGLGEFNETKKFYVNEGDADSSMIEPLVYSSTVEVETVALATFLDNNNIDKVKLLKLEAEGFEPEILNGAASVLSKIEYVAIDGGNERGVKKEETFSSQSNLLRANGFEQVGINFAWKRGLFRNTNI